MCWRFALSIAIKSVQSHTELEAFKNRSRIQPRCRNPDAHIDPNQCTQQRWAFFPPIILWLHLKRVTWRLWFCVWLRRVLNGEERERRKTPAAAAAPNIYTFIYVLNTDKQAGARRIAFSSRGYGRIMNQVMTYCIFYLYLCGLKIKPR